MSRQRPSSADEPRHRAGFVALLGPPNAGKSTLLNRVLGEKLAIVTAKPQTTRSRILGILSLPKAQILLQDTPGLHESSRELNRVMNETVADVLRESDLAILLVDRSRGWLELHEKLWRDLRSAAKPTLLVGTKADLPDHPELIWPPPDAAKEALAIFSISALTGEGVARLIEEIAGNLPLSPALYPAEDLTNRPLRWLCAELIREAVFECLEQELPYSMAVEIREFAEKRGAITRIRADLLVERNSQKRIVVGAGGRTVKGIGIRARKAIEKLLGERVHLELFVKEDPRWLKSRSRMEELGYF
jgi:GTP-binding protein Era